MINTKPRRRFPHWKQKARNHGFPDLSRLLSCVVKQPSCCLLSTQVRCNLKRGSFAKAVESRQYGDTVPRLLSVAGSCRGAAFRDVGFRQVLHESSIEGSRLLLPKTESIRTWFYELGLCRIDRTAVPSEISATICVAGHHRCTHGLRERFHDLLLFPCRRTAFCVVCIRRSWNQTSIGVLNWYVVGSRQ